MRCTRGASACCRRRGGGALLCAVPQLTEPGVLCGTERGEIFRVRLDAAAGGVSVAVERLGALRGGAAATALCADALQPGVLWVGGADRVVRALYQGQVAVELRGHSDAVRAVCVAGDHLYSAGEDGCVPAMLWQLRMSMATATVDLTSLSLLSAFCCV